MASRLSDVPGPTVELGAGLARFREVVPDVVETDVEETPWADASSTRSALPYEDGAAREPRDARRLPPPRRAGALPRRGATRARAGRTRRDARAVRARPCRRSRTGLHHERRRLRRRRVHAGTMSDDPLDANLAQTTVAFFRSDDELARRWPELALVERRRFSFFVYPLSGGFSRRPLLPAARVPAASARSSARWRRVLGRVAAFRSPDRARAALGLRPAIRIEPAIARGGRPLEHAARRARPRRSAGAASPGGGTRTARTTSTSSPASSNARRSSPARKAVSCCGDVARAAHERDVPLGPHLRVEDVRLAECEPAAGSEQREHVPQAQRRGRRGGGR